MKFSTTLCINILNYTCSLKNFKHRKDTLSASCLDLYYVFFFYLFFQNYFNYRHKLIKFEKSDDKGREFHGLSEYIMAFPKVPIYNNEKLKILNTTIL
jgi:hypothetical protein